MKLIETVTAIQTSRAAAVTPGAGVALQEPAPAVRPKADAVADIGTRRRRRRRDDEDPPLPM